MNYEKLFGIVGPVFMAAVLVVSFAGMVGLGNGITVPAQTGNVVNPPAPSAAPSGAKTAQLGYRNYAYYFPETGSDLLTVSPGQAIRFEMLLEGPNQLVGCMKSVLLPKSMGGQLKVARPGDNVLSFTAPETPGDYSFTCGMGMGVGRIRVAL